MNSSSDRILGESIPGRPSARGGGLAADLRSFVFRRPPVPTLITFDSETAREEYSQRIAQRLGIDVMQYAILNVHRIGINAPVRHVFEDLMQWDGRPTYWPNCIVSVEQSRGRPRRLQFFLLGKKHSIFGIKSGLFGLDFIPLFSMDLVSLQQLPDEFNFDNARYMLYECSGGYPVGICGIYVRSPINTLGEAERAQLFFAVGFNFYGKKDWPRRHIVNRIWEGIHNRVTANILNRFKVECEESFRKIQDESV